MTTGACNLVLCSLAGYAFARFRFLGRTALFAVLMATLMVPFQVTMIPQFIIVPKWLGVHVVLAGVGIDHLGALILPNAATAFGIFFLRQFFRTLAKPSTRSAREVDGASRLTVLVRIVLPLAVPSLATLAALTFLDSWNNFLWPLIAVTSTNQMTLPLGLATFQGAHATEWTLLMAANVMTLLPMLVIFFFAQRCFPVRSVAATGLPGQEHDTPHMTHSTRHTGGDKSVMGKDAPAIQDISAQAIAPEREIAAQLGLLAPGGRAGRRHGRSSLRRPGVSRWR